MKKILFAMLLLLSVTLIFSSCNSNDNSSDEENNTNEIYMNQKGSWSNGVEFEILDHRVTSEIESSLVTYTTQNKFIVLKLQVFNGSTDAFSADATDVWLAVNETKIYQQNFVERDVNGFSEINQSPTTTQCYYLVFEVGNDISMDDLKLVIHNGSLLNSEALVIKLKNSPKDCTVTLNYACERENDAHSFHSGTTIYSSNFSAPEREGYEFLGWYFNADYSGDVLTNYELSEKQELTLYAKWKKLVCVNYDYSYDSKTEKVFLNNGTTFDLPIPERLGYSFDGWYNNKSLLGNAITNISLITGDVSLYAKWIGNPVYLMYDGNGSTSGEMNNQLFYVGDTLALNENKFSRDGYTFIGWSIEKTNNDIIEDKAEYTMQPTSYEIVKIYAKWAKEIRTTDDFNTINANNSEHYVLANDIDFLGQAATTIKTFYGILDGNGFSIKNSSASLFVQNDGIIKNLTIIDSTFSFNGKCVGGFISKNHGSILNCGIEGNYSQTERQDSLGTFGGFCGSNSGVIANCYAKTDVSISIWGGSAGGFVGTSVGSILNCYSIGSLKVKEDHNAYAGGFIGMSYGGILKNCYTDIELETTGTEATGGFVGSVPYQTQFIGCIAIGRVTTSSNYKGGFFGIVWGASADDTTCYRSDVNLFTEGYSINTQGCLISNTVFYSLNFYVSNNIFPQYRDQGDNYPINGDEVWIINNGDLPKLYWE